MCHLVKSSYCINCDLSKSGSCPWAVVGGWSRESQSSVGFFFANVVLVRMRGASDTSVLHGTDVHFGRATGARVYAGLVLMNKEQVLCVARIGLR